MTNIINFNFVLLQAKMQGNRKYTDIALQHFDMFYKPVYGKLWPSIRVALLTTSKYCALLNSHHAQVEAVEEKLRSLGTQDGMELASEAYKSYKLDQPLDKPIDMLDDNDAFLKTEVNLDNIPERPSEKQTYTIDEDEENYDDEKIKKLEPLREKNTSLYDFVPAEMVYTDKEKLIEEEIQRSTYRGDSTDIPINFVRDQIDLPKNLSFFVYDRGDVRDFPAPKLKIGTQLGLCTYSFCFNLY